MTSLVSLRALVGEARELRSALDEDVTGELGAVVVSGMLAEQLARELGRGAEPAAVRVGAVDALRTGDVAVHVFAGEPGEDEASLAAAAERVEAPAVLVQLWPQEDWTPPFVLSPFVVECRPGAGFPVGQIAARIVDALDPASSLPDRVPVLQDARERRAVRGAVARAAVIGLVGGRGRAARPLITLEQARLLARLRPVPEEALGGREEAVAAATVGALEAWGHLLRGVARRARAVVPSRLADAAIAAGGTLALAEAAKVVRARLRGDER